MQEALDWLTAQPAVTWVAPAPRVQTHNFYATGLLQTGAAVPVNLSSNLPYGGAATTHSLWQAGLQVIPDTTCKRVSTHDVTAMGMCKEAWTHPSVMCTNWVLYWSNKNVLSWSLCMLIKGLQKQSNIYIAATEPCCARQHMC